jgi:hypothetical protein
MAARHDCRLSVAQNENIDWVGRETLTHSDRRYS